MIGPRPFLFLSTEALVANFERLKILSLPAECGAVVKANAYGLGVDWVIPALLKSGCKTFFVAYLEEGIEARKLAPQAEIYVFHGLGKGEEKIFFNNRLRPCVNSITELEQAIKCKLSPAVHVDTGINRLGIKKNIDIAYLPYVSLIMTHLACSDEPEHPMNASQEQKFTEWIYVNKAQHLRKSFLNSGGIFCSTLSRFNITRPGISLFGCSPNMQKNEELKSVLTWYAPILALSETEAGSHVGYGATCRLHDKTILATVATGYADGYVRSLSNKGWMYVNKVKCPVLGRISMDLTVIDVTEANTHIESLKVGQMVEVLGPNIPLDILAKMAGTIGYEILTGLGKRFNRMIDSLCYKNLG